MQWGKPKYNTPPPPRTGKLPPDGSFTGKPEPRKSDSLGEFVTEFLMGGHMAKKRFPDSTIVIGTAFEAGGVIEDWGFVVSRITDDGLKTISEARDLETALEIAKIKLEAELK